MKRTQTRFTAPQERQSVLIERRNLKMARSAHAYVRGNTERFYAWLQTKQATAIPQGPPVWICGDCHVGNLGPIANAQGEIAIQIRDLDQTVIGNPAHDLVRLGLSLASAAWHLSPALGERMLAAKLQDRAVFLRELLPQDLKFEIEQLTVGESVKVAKFLASVVGKAHARQLDQNARRAWRKELQRNRTKTLDAPSWLWSSVVELVVSHEGAYLEHCRQYALGAAA